MADETDPPRTAPEAGASLAPQPPAAAALASPAPVPGASVLVYGIYLFTLVLAFIFFQHAFLRLMEWGMPNAAAGFVTAVGLAGVALVARHWRTVLRVSRDVRFAVSLMLLIALSVVYGTLALQKQGAMGDDTNIELHDRAYAQKIGHLLGGQYDDDPAFAAAQKKADPNFVSKGNIVKPSAATAAVAGYIRNFVFITFADDLYHSAWFTMLLSVLAASLISITVQPKFRRAKKIPLVVTHAGIVIVLFGGLLWQMSGAKGMAHMHVGEAHEAFGIDPAYPDRPYFEIEYPDGTTELRRIWGQRVTIGSSTDNHIAVASGASHIASLHVEQAAGGGSGIALVAGDEPLTVANVTIAPNEGRLLPEGLWATLGPVRVRWVPNRMEHFPGFSLRLDGFEVEKYGERHHLYFYKRGTDGGAEAVGSMALEKKGWDEAAGKRVMVPSVGARSPVGASGWTVEVVSYSPSVRHVFYEAPEGAKNPPGLEVAFNDGTERPPIVLVPHGTRDDLQSRFMDQAGRFGFMFAYGDGEERCRMSAIGNAVIDTVTNEIVRAEIGKTVAFASGMTVTPVAFWPDFTFDRETKQSGTRSQLPNNPCLELDVVLPGATEAKRTRLFANMPDWQKNPQFAAMGALGLDLALIWSPNAILVADGKTKSLYRRIGDSATEAVALTGNRYRDEALGVTFSLRFFDRMAVRAERSSEAGDGTSAEAEVKLFPPGGGEPLSATLSMMTMRSRMVPAARQGEEAEYFVELSPKRDEPNKRFASILSIIGTDGSVLASQTVVVNDPLVWGGYYFYQANYDADDPTYSGIQVVRDPGMWWVYLGKVMMVLGSLGAFYFAGDRGVRDSGAGGAQVHQPLLAADGGVEDPSAPAGATDGGTHV